MFKSWSLICAAALLCACGAPQPRRPTTDATTLVPPAGRNVGTAAYPIDTARSELRILVHRAGPMARLGHNHVIVNRSLAGWAGVGAEPTAASLVLRIPVAGFTVDDAQAREAAGADFAESVAEDARIGTRRNMLSAAVLDADRFPMITLTSVAVHRTAGTSALPSMLSATLVVDVAGHRSTIEVPFTLDARPDGLTASGSMVLRQSALGITPFSVMLGAVQVRDDLRVEFRLVARTPGAKTGS